MQCKVERRGTRNNQESRHSSLHLDSTSVVGCVGAWKAGQQWSVCQLVWNTFCTVLLHNAMDGTLCQTRLNDQFPDGAAAISLPYTAAESGHFLSAVVVPNPPL